jgi:ribonuclease HI
MSAFHVLNTDASRRLSGEIAIGVVLRQKLKKGGPLTVVDYISKTIPAESITEAEYQALIEGLELASQDQKLTDLYVYSDAASVVKQVNEKEPKFKKKSREKLEPLHTRARGLIDGLGERLKTISYLPREMNTEADQRAADAFLVQSKGKAKQG